MGGNSTGGGVDVLAGLWLWVDEELVFNRGKELSHSVVEFEPLQEKKKKTNLNSLI